MESSPGSAEPYGSFWNAKALSKAPVDRVDVRGQVFEAPGGLGMMRRPGLVLCLLLPHPRQAPRQPALVAVETGGLGAGHGGWLPCGHDTATPPVTQLGLQVAAVLAGHT